MTSATDILDRAYTAGYHNRHGAMPRETTTVAQYALETRQEHAAIRSVVADILSHSTLAARERLLEDLADELRTNHYPRG